MTKQAKNYIAFLNDESGSMGGLRTAALNDYNANIAAVKNAATKYEQDTIVSMTTFGTNGGDIVRQVVNSNPHVLKPLAKWNASGGTPMFGALKDMISMLESLPDANEPHVSFTIITTTDGAATDGGPGSGLKEQFANAVARLSKTDRWTFVFRVPNFGINQLDGLNIPKGNIQAWDVTAAGLAESTAKTTAAVDNFFATRAAGKTSSTVFYADASQVSTTDLKKKLVRINDEVKLYIVPVEDMGIEMMPFILRHRMEYLKGAAFYQLTKTESKVQQDKLIIIRDRSNGDLFSGAEARKLIGLPDYGNARLHPGNHGNYDIFIQSKAPNRKLVGGTGVLYWAAKGVSFTKEELDKFYGKTPATPVAPAKPAVVELPKVAPTNKPTKSPVPVTPKAAFPTVNGVAVTFYDARSEARRSGKQVKDLLNYSGATVTGNERNRRWFTVL